MILEDDTSAFCISEKKTQSFMYVYIISRDTDINFYYMDKSVLLDSKPLVELICHLGLRCSVMFRF